MPLLANNIHKLQGGNNNSASHLDIIQHLAVDRFPITACPVVSYCLIKVKIAIL